MNDTDELFFDLADRLHIDARCKPQTAILDFWIELAAQVRRDAQGKIPLQVRVRMEHALELRVVTFRLQVVLGNVRLFQRRSKGASEGLRVVHPVVHLLERQHERLQIVTDQLLGVMNAPDRTESIGLYERIQQVLNETEGVLEQALEFEEGDEGHERVGNSDDDFP